MSNDPSNQIAQGHVIQSLDGVNRRDVLLCGSALLAASVLALNDPALATRLAAWRKQQTDTVKERPEGSA